MSTIEQSERGARAGQNQSLFREINDRVETLSEGFSDILPTAEWICECAKLTCTERITMTLEEYTGVRASSTHFAVAPGHVYPDVERVAARLEKYWVVEKLGEAADTAEQLDPRSDDDSNNET